MNVSKLLATRQNLLRQAHLANLAYFYAELKRLADHVALAQLRGRVKLRQAYDDEDFFMPTITALEGSQSVIEEHFSDDDVLSLVDGISFALEGDFMELEIQLEEIEEKYVAPLRATLDRAGIVIDQDEHHADKADKTN